MFFVKTGKALLLALLVAFATSCAPTLRTYTPATRTLSEREGAITCRKSDRAPQPHPDPSPPDEPLNTLPANLMECYSADDANVRATGASCVRLMVNRAGEVTRTESPWPFVSDKLLDCVLVKLASLRFPPSSSDQPRDFYVDLNVVR